MGECKVVCLTVFTFFTVIDIRNRFVKELAMAQTQEQRAIDTGLQKEATLKEKVQ